MLTPFAGRFKVSSKYGMRTGDYAGFHAGLDIVGLDSSDVLAIQSGVVKTSTRIPYYGQNDKTYEWGNYVKVQHDDGTYAFYCHLASRCVTVGKRVNKGDKIGVMGGTGKYDNSYGKHLHLEIRDANNTVTPKCNTPVYTGIPNIEQTISNTINEDDDMNKEETLKLIKEENEKLRSEIKNEKIYHYGNELPKWAYDDVKYLMDKGIFKGAAPNDLSITESELKSLCWIARSLKMLNKAGE